MYKTVKIQGCHYTEEDKQPPTQAFTSVIMQPPNLDRSYHDAPNL